MKEFLICCFLWSKRILKRPLFLFTLLFMPFAVLFLQNCQTTEDAIVRVALYTPDAERDTTAKELTDQLLKLSNHSLSFYSCSNKETLILDVSSGKANCGYIFPEHLESALQTYIKEHKPFITAVRAKEEIAISVVDEIILGKSYQKISYYILQAFIESKTLSAPDDTELTELFDKHADSELLFQFEYADGSGNDILNTSDTNFMLMPIRGIVAVFVLLSCMAGGLLWYSDDKKELLLLLDQKKQQYFRILSLLVPGFFASATGLLTIFLTGISGSLLRESLSMLLYLCSCVALTDVLRSLCRRREYFLATIPFFIIGSFILCPVFIDINIVSSNLAYLNKILPATYYLNTLHSLTDLGYLFLYAVILFIVSSLIRRGRVLFLK